MPAAAALPRADQGAPRASSAPGDAQHHEGAARLRTVEPAGHGPKAERARPKRSVVASPALTLPDLIRWGLAAVLVGAAGAKLAGRSDAREAFETYGIHGSRTRAAAWAATITVELAVAAALVADAPGAAAAAAIVFGGFTAALAYALARGRAGSPCGCFGRRSRVTKAGTARAATLAVTALALAAAPNWQPRTDQWLALGLGVALVAIALLALAVVALARELGELRLAIAPQAALSIDHEGPEIGSRVGVSERFLGGAPLALAVFTSATCSLCRALEPALELLARDSAVELKVFDEELEPAVWQSLAVPGSPYAVVLGSEGTVLAKGTFNTLLQLEGLLAAAERRDREPAFG